MPPIQESNRETTVEAISAEMEVADSEHFWALATKAGELIQGQPQAIWNLILKFGVRDDEDIREAIATCLLEHLLEHHFEDYFPKLENRVRAGESFLGSIFSMCWKFGQADLPENSAKWDRLIEECC